MAGLQQFGFSLDPCEAPQRHCFHDSDDEEEDTAIQNDVFDVEIASESSSVSLLVVGTSSIAKSFLSSHVRTELDPVATVKTTCPLKVLEGRFFPPHADEDLNTVEKTTVISKILRVKDKQDTLLCLNCETLKEDYTNGWSRKILESIKPQQVVIVHSIPSHSYFSYGYDSLVEGTDSHLKGLVTSCWTSEPLCGYLPQTNVIGGEPAAVMTHCQVNGIPAALVSLYVSNALTLREQVNCFKPILSHDLLATALSTRSADEADEKLASLVSPNPVTDLDLLYT